MLTKQEMIDYFLAQSGQFHIPEFLATSNMGDNFLKSIINQSLKTFSDFNPKIQEEILPLNSVHVFENPPSFIIDIRPHSNSQFYPQYSKSISKHYWSYESPRLTLRTGSGFYIVKMAFNHELDEECNIPSLSFRDNQFLNLFSAQMMISVGKSRRSFLMNDLPFTVDAESMISEGLELKDKTVEVLRERAKVHLGY